MPLLDFWLWRYPDPSTGRWRTTRHRMTCAEAAMALPGCEPVPGSLETRDVPADADAAAARLPNTGQPSVQAWRQCMAPTSSTSASSSTTSAPSPGTPRGRR